MSDELENLNTKHLKLKFTETFMLKSLTGILNTGDMDSVVDAQFLMTNRRRGDDDDDAF